MTQRTVQDLGLTLVLAMLLAIPVGAQTRPKNTVDRVASPAEEVATKEAFKPGGIPVPAATVDPAAIWKEEWICESSGPAEVTGYRVTCANATFLDFHIADCCVPGDHWQLKGKAWDVNPNTAVTTSPGPANAYGLAGRVYNYGGTGWNPGGLDAYVECSYLNGVNLFAAGSYVLFSSDGTCTVTPDPVVRRIDRTP